MVRTLAVAALIAASAPAARADVATPPNLDVSGLDDGQKKWLNELLEEFPSACVKSQSLATSLKSDPKCKRSPIAAAFVVRLLKLGLLKSEVEEHYDERFVHPTMARCEIAGAPLRGSPTATVALVEFSDYECPHCKAIEPVLGKILEEYKGKVKLYFKNYPIEKLHPDARDAAAAAVAAGEQGKFWPMHDKLFENQDHLSATDLEKYASDLKLDVKKWKTDLANARKIVERDHDEGEKLEVSATPTLYINGCKFKGPHRYEEVKDWIDWELAR
jgi:predicted DsbA family dithiol-disulfide isomerase